MKHHEVAQIFPLLDGNEYQQLVRDIRERGLIEPIWTYQGKIIDGRNRHRACVEAAIEPRYREWSGRGSLVGFIISLNLHRRHLTASQRAAIAVDVLPHLETEAKERQRGGQGGVLLGADSPEAFGRAAEKAGELVGIGGTIVKEAKAIREKSPESFERIRSGESTVHAAKLSIQKAESRELSRNLVLPQGKYRTIVVDPPWPMAKIERTERPNQQGFEYPTMTPQELMDFPLTDFAHDDCHLYLWVTHKHLPLALRVVDHWGFRYQCLMTWVKNVGFTPFSWMYSTEHVLFCRRGSLDLLKLGLRLDFTAKVREHSRKPDEFYDLVRQASPEPRIDVFGRESRDGFDIWGHESEKFADGLQSRQNVVG